jgi:hypothetical protein
LSLNIRSNFLHILLVLVGQYHKFEKKTV